MRLGKVRLWLWALALVSSFVVLAERGLVEWQSAKVEVGVDLSAFYPVIVSGGGEIYGFVDELARMGVKWALFDELSLKEMEEMGICSLRRSGNRCEVTFWNDSDFFNSSRALASLVGGVGADSRTRRLTVLSPKMDEILVTPLYFHLSLARYAKRRGLKVVLRFREGEPSDYDEVVLRSGVADGVAFLGKKVWADTSAVPPGVKVFLIENYRQSGFKKWWGKWEFVRCHVIPRGQLGRYDEESALARYRRAILERRASVVILRPLKISVKGKENLKKNVEFVKRCVEELSSEERNLPFNLSLGKARDVLDAFVLPVVVLEACGFLALFLSGDVLLWILAFLLFAWGWIGRDGGVVGELFLSIVVPMGFANVLLDSFRGWRPWLAFSRVFGFSLIVTALFSQEYFTSGVGSVGGVKLSLLLGVLVAFLWVYGVESVYDLKRLFSRGVNFGDAFFGAVLLAFLGIALTRSGNGGVPFPYEESVRRALENVFVVRPRFKELLFYPFLYFGTRFYLPHIAFFGVFALWSTFDSFLHFHTPIYVTLYRTLLGFLLPIVPSHVLAFLLSRFRR